MTNREAVLTNLFHGDFSTAKHLADIDQHIELDDDTRELIDVLARQFGDVGLLSGDIGVIVRHALDNIGVFDDDAPDLKIVR